MTDSRLVVGGIAIFVTLALVPGGINAQEFSIFSNFDADTPGSPPTIGGPDQPTGIINGGVLVQSSANGIATQPLEVADADCSASSWYAGGVYYNLPTPVMGGVLRIEVTVAANQITTGIFFDAGVDYLGISVARLTLNGLGQITDYFGTVLGSYAANTPLRLRADIDMDSKTWACTIDDELNGFEDDTVTSGLAFTNDAAAITQVGTVHLDFFGSFYQPTCVAPRTFAYDDVLITTGLPIFADGFESGDTASWSSTVSTPTDRLVIFDGGGTSGSIGGRLGADVLCSNAAQSIPVIPGSAIRGLISVSASDEIRDLPMTYGVPTDRPITSQAGVAIADNWSDLLDGTIDQSLVAAGALASGTFWYSGSLDNGSVATTTCSGWTDGSTLLGGRYGSSSATDGRWINNSDATCGSPMYHVLCLAWD